MKALRTILYFLLIFSSSLVWGETKSELPPKAELIDMHCHIAGVGAGNSGCTISEELRHSFRFGFYLGAFQVKTREVEAKGDTLLVERTSVRLAQSHTVGRAVLLALDGPVDASGNLDREKTEVYIPNDFVAAQVAAHPNLLFGASINPLRCDALERLERAYGQGAVLVKWLPAIQGFDPSDKRLIPFYRRLAEMKLPLLVHTGEEHSFTKAEDRLSDPELLRLPLSLGVKVIAAHASATGKHQGERDIERLCRLMKEYPNLYADISSLTQINKRGSLREVLMRSEMKGRLVYGTDFPLVAISGLCTPLAYAPQIGWLNAWRISRIENPWDRDVALKQALGVPADVWGRAQSVLRMPTAKPFLTAKLTH